AGAHPELEHPWPAVWLAAFALAWVTGFDIIYATLDEAFDRENCVHSMVAWLGRPRALVVSAVLHALAFGCLVVAAFAVLALTPHRPAWAMPGTIVALGVTGALLWLEQRWANDVDLAFFKVNVIVG